MKRGRCHTGQYLTPLGIVKNSNVSQAVNGERERAVHHSLKLKHLRLEIWRKVRRVIPHMLQNLKQLFQLTSKQPC